MPNAARRTTKTENCFLYCFIILIYLLIENFCSAWESEQIGVRRLCNIAARRDRAFKSFVVAAADDFL
jgi:hypothetical protein